MAKRDAGGRRSYQGAVVVCGAILIDDLVFADGRRLDGVLGGAGLYALAGAALWSEDIILVSGAGEDAKTHVLPWMRRAALASTALRLDGPFTPRNTLVYKADGTRTETPVFGPEHFARLQPRARDLAAVMPGAAGAYVFRDADPAFWSAVSDAAQASGVRLLWEISCDICQPSHRAEIANVARGVDALSINLEEAQGLFGAQPTSSLCEGLRSLGAPVVFLRCAAAGSLVITADAVVQVPAGPAEVVDVTGAGNAYGGAALAGLATGADPSQAGRMGAVAARFAIAQHGPFVPRDPGLREHARHALLTDSPVSAPPSLVGL